MIFPEVERARPGGYYDPPPEEDEHLEPEEIEALFERVRSRLRRAAEMHAIVPTDSQGKRQAGSPKRTKDQPKKGE